MSKIVAFNFEDNTVRSDNMVSGTALTRAYKEATGIRKDCTDWLRTQEAKDSIAYLEGITGNPVVLVQNGGSEPGTWLHPDLAEILAQWISVEYRFAVVKLIRDTKAGRVNLERQIQPTATLKEIKEAVSLAKYVYGKAYAERYAAQMMQKHQPHLCFPAPKSEETTSLPSVALLTPTEIATQLGWMCKSNAFAGDARRVNRELEALGYQTKISGQWSATEKAINAGVCDRKPVDTNSRTQKDQLMWTIKIIDVLKEMAFN